MSGLVTRETLDVGREVLDELLSQGKHQVTLFTRSVLQAIPVILAETC